MGDDACHDSMEELATGTSTPTGRVLLVVVVLIATPLALVLVFDRLRSGPPPARSTSSVSADRGLPGPSAAMVLHPGSPTGNALGPRLVYTVELDNTTGADVTVRYPIQLLGARSKSATVSYLDLAATGELINFDAPPDRVTNIAAHGEATLQIGLYLRCQSTPKGLAWPAGNSKIAVRLVGYPRPAVFTFADLFGFNIRADLRRACDWPVRGGNR